MFFLHYKPSNMNKFLVFACVFAVCACLAKAATITDVEKAIDDACDPVKQEAMLGIKSSFRGSMISPTATPMQRFCAIRQISRAPVAVIFAVNGAKNAEKAEYQTSTPEELETVDLEEVTTKARESCTKAVADYTPENLTSNCQ